MDEYDNIYNCLYKNSNKFFGGSLTFEAPYLYSHNDYESLVKAVVKEFNKDNPSRKYIYEGFQIITIQQENSPKENPISRFIENIYSIFRKKTPIQKTIYIVSPCIV